MKSLDVDKQITMIYLKKTLRTVMIKARHKPHTPVISDETDQSRRVLLKELPGIFVNISTSEFKQAFLAMEITNTLSWSPSQKQGFLIPQSSRQPSLFHLFFEGSGSLHSVFHT